MFNYFSCFILDPCANILIKHVAQIYKSLSHAVMGKSFLQHLRLWSVLSILLSFVAHMVPNSKNILGSILGWGLSVRS